MGVIVTCVGCGGAYEAPTQEVRAGTWLRRCPTCRPAVPPVLPSERRARTMRPRDWAALDRNLRRSGGEAV